MSIFTNPPIDWTPDTKCDSDTFNQEIKEKMDDLDKGIKSKIIITTRVMTADSGDVSYSGVGFMPTSIIVIGNAPAGNPYISIGMGDSAKASGNIHRSTPLLFTTDTLLIKLHYAEGEVYQKAIIKSYDADGFTLTWTKAGSPTGTAELIFLCFR